MYCSFFQDFEFADSGAADSSLKSTLLDDEDFLNQEPGSADDGSGVEGPIGPTTPDWKAAPTELEKVPTGDTPSEWILISLWNT